MDIPSTRPGSQADPPFDILVPAQQRLPLVLASPHSGRDYPAEFLAASRLDPVSLRRSEDSFVDELFAAAPRLGVPLLRARFPRAFCDANREALELDPTMFADPLPPGANIASPRVAAGLGVIARVVASGAEIYRGKLRFAEARRRLAECYEPYHAALRDLVDRTRAQFGYCLLVDCHSMPSAGPGPAGFVLGDCFGSACAGGLTAAAERYLRGAGHVVVRNDPYAGGFTTRHYGRPSDGVHALQIEMSRALYMDEATLTPHAGFATLAADLSGLISALGATAIPSSRANTA